nr:MAG TPA: hypothetical protein [Caudoviricetes sp.]
MIFRVLKRERTDHCKMLRRIYGDNGGMMRFADKKIAVGGIVMNTVTTLPSKDNLIFEIHDGSEKNQQEKPAPLPKSREW